jgi:signal transduction histidine kinase
MGISPETKAKLFQKFSRGEGGKINTGGSGLGLYLAKEIAAAHKGMVDVESEGMGKGSTFVLEMEEYKEAQKI